MGKNSISKGLDKAVTRGRIKEDDKHLILQKITTVEGFESFKECDLVIECVIENSDLKKGILEELEKIVSPETLIATNTSSLPLGWLGENLKNPERFMGLHFFSPVPMMDLVEIIKGPETKKEHLVQALKFTKDLGKTPILVRDGLGFFTTRVFTRYITEAIALLKEGYNPALIENAGRLLGFPLGPLEIADEVSLTLIQSLLEEKLKFLKTTDFDDPTERITLDLVKDFISTHERVGKKGKKGFYDYNSEKGKSLSIPTKALRDPEKDKDFEVCQERLLSIQMVEALKCYEEGIINTAHEGDVASILGWGFPFHTGGIINLCHQQGNQKLLEKLIRLQGNWGSRFSPPKILKSLINKNYDTLHEAREILAEPFLEN
jgi:3-hydroxyacyl-CoA dehydrogenase/enoyl-CoA hydratase/3-hydroxybutyryl-CoA epimerase